MTGGDDKRACAAGSSVPGGKLFQNGAVSSVPDPHFRSNRMLTKQPEAAFDAEPSFLELDLMQRDDIPSAVTVMTD